MTFSWPCVPLLALLLAGCGPALPDPDGGSSVLESDGATSGSTGDVPAPTPTETLMTAGTTTDQGNESSGSGPDVGEGPEPEELCPDRQWEVSASGTNLGLHEGRRVWLSAVEPDRESDDIVVRLETIIEAGAFDLVCVSGLSTNYLYPSIAVVIDEDDDGACSDGDVAFVWQLFGWESDQRYAFDGSEVHSLESEPPWLIDDDAWRPVNEIGRVWGRPFCDYYLP